MPPSCCEPFAPTQVYLAATLTVAFVGWILRANGHELPIARTIGAGFLIGLEILHALGYELICDRYGSGTNIFLHRMLVLVLLVFVAFLIWMAQIDQIRKEPGAIPGSVLGLLG